MVPKTEAISYTTMRMGSALAVIRYNGGGMGDLSRVFEILGIKESAAIKDLFTELDAKRVRQSRTIHKIQTQRLMDRQCRTRKDSSKRKKHGVGYQSGKFSGSAVISEDETLEELEFQVPDMNPEASCTIPQKVNVKRASCGVCGEEEAGSVKSVLCGTILYVLMLLTMIV